MIAPHNQHATTEDSFTHSTETSFSLYDIALSKNQSHTPAAFLAGRHIIHHPRAGLNPVVDAAAYLFSALGKLKQLRHYHQLNELQAELIQEINAFQETIRNYGYNAEYIIVCRYIIAATFDDIICNTPWGAEGQWEPHLLLEALNQDTQHHDKFFSILERAIKEPALYIDLMELIYIALSMGYKGQYRSTEYNQFQLEQITHNLYQHIRAYRGNISKTLSPMPLKAPKTTTETIKPEKTSPFFVFFITACVVMMVFVSLGYLMDLISNEAYKNIAQIEHPINHDNMA
ncbi:MAG: hypothetical protein A3F14_05970 [Gammaproteobacteria bacterium RIFCSPHIGHO2_12_FULL_43_28]|nr:MAG: hypothetical protein A3F14_05970 [Gammaproteobacteria bacterium RIFCSPHIGHO2_12_FULL_43_28]